MKVILTANVKDIGQKGEDKEVKPGFGRNFLLPRGLAVAAESPEGQRELQAKESEEEKHQDNAGKIAEIVNKNQGLILNYKSKASKENKLFGSIKILQIKNEIKDKIGIKPDKIEPNKSIKAVGEYKLKARLPENQILSFIVVVEAATSGKKT